MDFATQIAGFSTNFLYWFIAPLAVFTVVVFIHELGHFLVGRWCGVKVVTFSIGFGPEIFGFYDRHGTRWKFAWIPLGGYVKFVDDENAASVPDREKFQQLSEEERAQTVQGRPLWQRAAIVAAGPIANFILTLFLFAGLLGIMGENLRVPRIDAVKPGSAGAAAGFQPGDVVKAINDEQIAGFRELLTTIRTNADERLKFTIERGGKDITILATPRREELPSPVGGTISSGVLGLEAVRKPYISGVFPGRAAAKAGLQKGDLVLAIDGKPIPSFKTLVAALKDGAGKTLQFRILRDGREITLPVVPGVKEVRAKDGSITRHGVIGVQISAPPGDFVRKRYGPFAAMWKGTYDTYKLLKTTLIHLRKIIVGKESAKQLGGPITIVQMSSQVAAIGLDQLIWWTAVISASIGLINLFPIPMLDGGHLMFYAYEAIRGRPMSERAQAVGFAIGAVMIFSLMIFVIFNDLMRLKLQLLG